MISRNELSIQRSSISHEEIQTLPLCTFNGNIHVITTPEELGKIMQKVSKENIVGFDTETRPAFVKGQRYNVALVQLATDENAWLIRLHHTGFVSNLISFLENRSIQKVGIGLRDDISALQRIKRFTPAGFTELTTLSKQMGIEAGSLKKLTGLLLGLRVSKSSQTSNWEAPALTEKQIEYAAIDAWACLKIYKKLLNYNPPLYQLSF